MEKKQTAVNWLIDFFEDYFALVPVDVIEQAKAMEKEQIVNAYWDGGEDMPMISKQCEQYYNEKFEA
jgi:hypothetical protein